MELMDKLREIEKSYKEIEARMAKPEYYAEYVRYLKKLTDFDEKLHIKNRLKRAN